MEPVLTADAVHKIALESLFKEGENSLLAKEVPSHLGLLRFHPRRVLENKDKITTLLGQVSERFREDSESRGATMLIGNFDANERVWTTDIVAVSSLFSLGQAVDLVVCPIPQPVWGTLPGNAPYYIIRKDVKSLKSEMQLESSELPSDSGSDEDNS